MNKKLKSFLFIIPLSLVLLSHTSANTNNTSDNIARSAGGGGGRAGGGFDSRGMDAGRAGFDNNAGFNHIDGADRNWNNNYGGGTYYNGGYYGGYGPYLLPDSNATQDPNDDMNSIYNQNLRNMEKTGL